MENGISTTTADIEWDLECRKIFETDKDLRDELAEWPLEIIVPSIARYLGSVIGYALPDPEKYWNLIRYKFGRPVYSIIKNDIQLHRDDPQSNTWLGRMKNNISHLRNDFPAVGRINIANHPEDIDWIGTGWFIKDDIIVTNRHVADKFSKSTDNGYEFIEGKNNHPVEVSIDMLEEDSTDNNFTEIFSISEVIFIEPSNGFDIAFLRANSGDHQFPAALQLSDPIKDHSDVVTIGYPGRWINKEEQNDIDRIFRNVWGKKRVAPGRVQWQNRQVLVHDCSTLIGCSGSPVIDLETGNVIALHYGGIVSTQNESLPSAIIKQIGRQLEIL